MTRGTGKRQYLACERCRRRKTKCDLSSVGETGKPPCLDCFRIGFNCTLATSRRGGDYSQYKKRKISKGGTESHLDEDPTQESNIDGTDSDIDLNESMQAELKNPSDALQILTKANVKNDLEDGIIVANDKLTDDGSLDFQCRTGLSKYELVRRDVLQLNTVIELLQWYAKKYHCFSPIAPKHILNPENLDQTADEDGFLLTVILTIASRAEKVWSDVHTLCWQYMKQLLMDVLLALPSTHKVGTVEGLLILSEWIGYNQLELNSLNGSFAEDNTAWSLIGQAVRHGYLLRLDKTSFRENLSFGTGQILERERLAWTYVFFADRQISARMGQSFWSRGPALSTKFNPEEFSTLKPTSREEVDYRPVLHAIFDLTQLLHNVHDILYSSQTRTLGMFFMGDYSRYLDDFLKALMMWNNEWGIESFTTTSTIRSVLSLVFEYLRLYVTSFSFQAVISRTFASGISKGSRKSRSNSFRKKSGLFARGVMASPDGQYIFEAIHASKKILQIIGEEIDPEECLRYMPCRFFLYGIYSGVFLYKADVFGAITINQERQEVVRLIRGFVMALEKSAKGDENHIGFRYSKLMKVLWVSDLNPSALKDNHRSSKVYRRDVPVTRGSGCTVDGSMSNESLGTSDEQVSLSGSIGQSEFGNLSPGNGEFSNVPFPFTADDGLAQGFSAIDNLFGLGENFMPTFDFGRPLFQNGKFQLYELLEQQDTSR